MTDNEIKKALDEAELFLRNRTTDGMSLELNEYDIGILRDISQVCARAYDEITRQKAEIERLQETICMLTKTGRFYSTVRAEAIKECIKTIKEKLRDLAKIDFRGQYCYLIAEAFFDNIFEEMVGDV